MNAKQALSDLIDAIDEVHAFVDLEAGQDGNGDVVRACRAINKPIPHNLAQWFAENDVFDDDTEFNQWLNDLNLEAEKRGYSGASTMWQATGAGAWRGYYDDGFSPADALTDDAHQAS
jgi:hypothetical protein